MSSVTLHRDGTSVGFTFPEDTCARMGLEAGQKLTVVELEDGLKLVRHEGERSRQMELARKVLRDHAEVLRELAQR